MGTNSNFFSLFYKVAFQNLLLKYSKKVKPSENILSLLCTFESMKETDYQLKGSSMHEAPANVGPWEKIELHWAYYM